MVELPQSPSTDLSSKELVGLEQEHAAGEEGKDISPVFWRLMARHLAMALAGLDAGLQIISDSDPNLECSLRVHITSCSRELFKEKRGPKWWWWGQWLGAPGIQHLVGGRAS